MYYLKIDGKKVRPEKAYDIMLFAECIWTTTPLSYARKLRDELIELNRR